ncbi:MAG: flavodoxin family protein [Sphaerochaeta sp.]
MINIGPHEAGATNRALGEVTVGLTEYSIDYETLWVGTDPIQGCTDCGYCFTHGECAFSDLVNVAAKKIRSSDGLIIGSPVHYASAANTLFLDRLFRVISKDVALKAAAAVVSCRRGGASSTFDQLNKYFTISQMLVVSSAYWNSVHGNNASEVEHDHEGLQMMRILGRNMGYVISKLNGVDVSKPNVEKRVWTNFISLE